MLFNGLKISLYIFYSVACINHDTETVTDICLETECPGVLMTSFGSPVNTIDTRTLNSNLLRNNFFMESATHLVRERIPERPVTALGAGAFGYFEMINDISQLCKANLFNGIGKRTPVAVRFSLTTADKGASDITRSARGFAIKFYTEEGNYDLLGISMPIFPIKDPLFFPNIVHAVRRHPVSNLPDENMLWDFVTLRPESFHFFLMTFGDTGVTDGFRHMPGFGVHTFQVVNRTGGIHFFKYHLVPDAGIRNLLPEEERIAALDPNYARRDLYTNIANGNYPSWTLSVQVVTLDEARKNENNVFDVTRELSSKRYPLHVVGRLVLNQNPINFFAQIEQLAFSPANLVPGIVGAPDKLFEGRSLMYRDSAMYRLGVNFNNIPVNCPIRGQSINYLRDGSPPVNDNGGNVVNYYPNTFNGPMPYVEKNRVDLIQITEEDAYNFDQARDLYINRMSEGERRRVVDNILITLSPAIPRLQKRAISLFNSIHPDLANRVSLRLRGNLYT